MNILVTDRYAASAIERLKLEPGVIVNTSAESTDLSSYDALLIRSRTKINSELLVRASKLKIIVTSTSGFDHIDLEECKKRGVRVFFTPEANATSAAELTWGLILMTQKKLFKADECVRKTVWDRTALIGSELANKTLGIIGLGRVGKKVAKIARAFDMNIIASDPYIEESDFFSVGATRAGWEEVFKSADILTFHVPLTKETKNFVNQATLESLNHGAVVINTSRGGVINELAAAEALRKGKIAYMALDVFEKEPLPKDSALFNLPNIILTPHIGANTNEAFERGSQAAVDKILAFREGGKVCDELTKEI